MSELQDLYQQVILDHNRSPRNFREIEDTDHSAEGFNPLCGDQITVYMTVTDDTVEDVAFQGKGCAICTASASVMTQLLKGKDLDESETLFHRFHELVTGEKPAEPGENLGKLAVFAGVSEFPVRVKCASLPWHTYQAALKQQAIASTE